MPTFQHGKNTNFQIQDSGGVTRDISNVLSKTAFPEKVDKAEVTAYGAASKSYLVGLKDSTISLDGKYDATVDGYLSGLLGFATPRTFIYGPMGSTAGNVKYTGTCILVTYNVDSPLDAAAGFSAEFQITGDVTRTVY